MAYETEQEAFWAGEFGDAYVERNTQERLLNSKIAMWARILRSAHGIGSAMEFGCNIGLNLLALNGLRPSLDLMGIEINERAAAMARDLGVGEIRTGSILAPTVGSAADLTFTAGVLIHIDPMRLGDVYDNLVACSRRYVMVAEYYNPSPVAVPYRNHADRLFKRDFAGELIERHGLHLVDYGFVYRRDNWAPQDDITWFLLEK